ncbi:HNH endonuclease family protein [Streptomyces sp. NBC_01198]|uniref:HNH endonuclease family protein n=1 Tax=Streptomyces sp. NBC_01198 TaxID=2903769 RepID=UPI002E1095CB|nr:HNH endonuclease family protein [Streptomyces sp. NBC_01198]
MAHTAHTNTRAARTLVCTAALAVALGGTLAGCKDPTVDAGTGSSSSSGASAPSGHAGKGSALAAVGDLTVKGRAPKTGYSRDRFGPAWADTDHNHCDTRDDILKRDLRQTSFRDGAKKCIVTSGTLADPYTGKKITYTRGASKVDIDHAVALSDAWQKGAAQWKDDKREDFANDPLNLLAVDSSTNRRKSDGDTATWLPPNAAYRCDYVARQVAVKKKYGLWVTSAERDAMRKVLGGCSDEKLPTG